MKIAKQKQLFEGYANFWIVKLELHKKYRISFKADRRYCHTDAVTIQETPTTYVISYNPNNLKSENRILHAVLHEIGHLLHSWKGKEENHEFFAEYFALSTAKEHYPKEYRKMVNRTKKDLIDLKSEDNVYVKGYIYALRKLGEIDDSFDICQKN